MRDFQSGIVYNHLISTHFIVSLKTTPWLHEKKHRHQQMQLSYYNLGVVWNYSEFLLKNNVIGDLNYF